MKEIIEALTEFNASFKKLNLKWDEFDEMDELDAIGKYPFEKSFDELTLEVDNWVEKSIEEISKKYE